MLNLSHIIIVLILFFSFTDAKTLTNKKWITKKNLTAPISLYINGKKLDLDKDSEEIIKYYQSKPYDYYFLPKSRKISNTNKENAKNIKKNIYLLRKNRDSPIELPSDLTWAEDPFNDRNWKFWFQNWKFADCLIDGYIAFQDPWYLQRMKWLVSDWWEDNFKEKPPSKEFSWNDHTIPIRMHHMIEIFEFIRRNNALDDSYLKVALRSIYWHARILAEEEALYFKNHNHGLDQSIKLFEVSQLFPEFTLSSSWEEISRKRLKNEISFALTTEGIHKENSPGYHAWVSTYCANVNEFSQHYTGKSIIKTNNKKLQDGGLKFITTITRPDNTLPQIGDTSPKSDINILYPLQKKLSWYPYYEYVKSNGKRGEKPLETTTIFKESGYFIYRDKWDDPGKNDAFHLILKCGFLAKGHRHNDDGNILLYAFGEDWLIDAGIYGYQYNKYRTYVVSPSAHNISFPYSTKLKHAVGSNKITTLKTRFSQYKDNWGLIESNTTHALCESHMFNGFTYNRTLDITGEHSFTLRDKLTSDNPSGDDSYMTLFKVPDNKDVYINTNKKTVLVLNTAKDAALKIHYFTDFPKIELHRGEESPIISLETVNWLKMRPAKTISFSNTNTPYIADFKLDLVTSPNLDGYEEMPITLDKVEVNIKDNLDEIIFNILPVAPVSNLQVAFYLYKDGKRIDTKRYSKEFFYKLKKDKYGSGKYRIRYFIVDDNVKNPWKSKKKKMGYSKYIDIN